jgi:hypothetical protein
VKLASRGQRDLDSGPEVITDAAELTAARRQARSVHVKSLIAAAILTMMVLLL